MSDPKRFHPVIQRWWAEWIGGPPTPAQAGGWPQIRAGRDTLIAAPTGSGKTLAAFLHALDSLLREGLERGGLPDEVRVIYVSPLKALSADVHRNLAEPRREIRRLAEEMGLPPVRITAAIRSGDTTQGERARMLRTPPHVLVTTPESLYLLLTAERGRELLSTARTVIVDEIHAVIETRRGAHLALSLERLDHVAGRRLQRIGLSATQKPIEQVAEFLTGGCSAAPAATRRGARRNGGAARGCAIVDEGHVRELDLALELPPSPLEAVMSNEVWAEVYDRLARLIDDHHTTIVFVNTRRLAERAARALCERLGEGAVMPHHGSLAKEARLEAEERLKTGRVRALVATASLELGIDIGHVDLVCQLGSPRRIATFLQRVGRSGHTVHGTPKGRLFPLTRDELVECAALLRAVRAGELDRLIVPPQPLDVLAQQLVAEAAAEEWSEDALFALVRRAYPYRELERGDFDALVSMLARGISTHRGRRAALLHHDTVNGRVRGRKGSRSLAITSGGAIPDVADYRVVLEPDGTFIGTVNEDFAVESMTGDIFQLGNTAWRVLKLETGVMRVADASGEVPNVPFWLGEAPARSDELSRSVATLRADVEARLDGAPDQGAGQDAAVRFLVEELALPVAAAEQLVPFLAETRRLLGAVPTQETLVLERFFDEAGGMQLVLHAPFGARVNRAWGLALRKKFCQSFDFELQAAATDEGVLLSLGPQHSFPLEDVFRYLNPATLGETLVQAMLDSPIFVTRWRRVAMLALAVPRARNGQRTPPQIQRMIAEDLLGSVFPDATACLEHVVGAREVPDHPLVSQTIRDCLEEAMDLPALEGILRRLLDGELRLVARDTTEPSPLAAEIVNARVYQFLDDAPLEERRAAAVRTRRALEPSSAGDLGALDATAIERVREEAWPSATDADELHDALLTSGFLLESEVIAHGDADWRPLFAELAADLRAISVAAGADRLWVAAERLPELLAARPTTAPDVELPAPRGTRTDWEPAAALVELLRSRMEVFGPATNARIASWLDGVGVAELEAAVLALETEGRLLRGHFTPGGDTLEWCDRRLLARIHRYTLDRLRAEIEPVSARDFLRFLFRWLRADAESRAAGPDGVAAVVEQLAGFEAAAAAWEADVLPLRVQAYDPAWLDQLCLSGRLVWGRLGGRRGGAGPVRATPLALLPREALPLWLNEANGEESLSSGARAVRDALEARGASFFHELVAAAGLLPTQVEAALGELVAAGVATSDAFSGLRALLVPEAKRAALSTTTRRRRARASVYSVANAGRWSLLRTPTTERTAALVEEHARALLRRYGVVFRRLLAREPAAPAWRELVRAYRTLEARGEIRGGRFVAGMAGEQFALPEAVGALRAARRAPKDGVVTVVSAADPLNLVGIVTPEAERVPASHRNRILFRDGAAVAALEGGRVRFLSGHVGESEEELRRALGRAAIAPPLRPYLRGDRPADRARRTTPTSESRPAPAAETATPRRGARRRNR